MLFSGDAYITLHHSQALISSSCNYPQTARARKDVTPMSRLYAW